MVPKKIDMPLSMTDQLKYNNGVFELSNGMYLWLGIQYYNGASIYKIRLEDCENIQRLIYEALSSGEDYVYDEIMYELEEKSGIKPCFPKQYCGYLHVYVKITADSYIAYREAEKMVNKE